MTDPLPNWRLFTEDSHGMILEVDVSPTEQIYVSVPERIFGTDGQSDLIRSAVAKHKETRGIVETPGEGPEAG